MSIAKDSGTAHLLLGHWAATRPSAKVSVQLANGRRLSLPRRYVEPVSLRMAESGIPMNSIGLEISLPIEEHAEIIHGVLQVLEPSSGRELLVRLARIENDGQAADSAKAASAPQRLENGVWSLETASSSGHDEFGLMRHFFASDAGDLLVTLQYPADSNIGSQSIRDIAPQILPGASNR